MSLRKFCFLTAKQETEMYKLFYQFNHVGLIITDRQKTEPLKILTQFYHLFELAAILITM